jgi:hypothetical protein
MITQIQDDFGNKKKMKCSFGKISNESYLMTWYLPGDWLWNFLAENILCDKNGVICFLGNKPLHLDCTEF